MGTPLSWPIDVLPDVEAQRQSNFQLNNQHLALLGRNASDNSIFVAARAQEAFLQAQAIHSALALQLATNINNPMANAILTQRSARDQPNVSPTIAFVPSPATAQNPSVPPKTA